MWRKFGVVLCARRESHNANAKNGAATRYMDEYQKLGVGKSTSIIQSLEVSRWGTKVVLYCLYDPRERKPYKLSFKNCKHVRLDVIDGSPPLEPTLIGISLGDDAYGNPAIVTTTAFEISVLYQEWELQWI